MSKPDRSKQDRTLPGFHRPFEGVDKRVSVEQDERRAAAAVVTGSAHGRGPSSADGQQPGGSSRDVEREMSDDALFAAEMSDVNPADRSASAQGELGRRKAVSPAHPALNGKPGLAAVDEAPLGREGEPEFGFFDQPVEGVAPGVNRQLLKRLKRGEFAASDRLDLHGQTRKEAGALVERFIGRSRAAGLRCVLIIHGRGLHSEGGAPVLKDALGGWLLGGRVASSVLAFCSARPADGGRGAVYVLLRR